jgi:hypothetical protein
VTDLLSALGNLPIPDTSGGPYSDPVINPALPQYQKTIADQLLPSSPLAPILAQVSPNVAAAFRDYQAQRVAQGQAPWQTTAAQQALTAADTGQAATPEPEQGFWGNAVHDIESIAQTANLKLIPALADELSQVTSIPTKLDQAFTGANPLEAIGNVAKIPGLRLIPGSYLAGTLATGGPGLVQGLQEHPVFSALDVLPYASKAAEASRVVQTAEELNLANRATLSEAGLAVPPSKVPPIKTFLRNWRPGEPAVTDITREVVSRAEDGTISSAPVTTQALVPNDWGQLVDNFKQAFNSSGPGGVFQQMRSPSARTATRGYNLFAQKANLADEVPELATFNLEPVAIRQKYFADLPTDEAAAQIADLDTILRMGDPDALASLPPSSQAAAAEMQALREAFDEKLVADGRLTPVPMADASGTIRNELYLPEKAKVILGLREKAAGSTGNILDHYNGIYAPAPAGVAGEDWRLTQELAHGERYQTYLDSPDTQRLVNQLNTQVDGFKFQDAADTLTELRRLDTRPASLDFAQAISDLKDVAKWEVRPTNIPARFMDLITERVQQGLRELVPHDIPAADQASMLSAIQHRLFSDAGFSPEQIDAQLKQSAALWKDLAAQGHEPVFVHRVSPERAESSLNPPKLFDYTPTPASLKERLFDAAPSVNDPFLAMSSEAKNYISEFYSRKYINEFLIPNFARTEGSLRKLLLPEIDRVMADNPLRDSKSALAELIRREGLVPFEPNRAGGSFTVSPGGLESSGERLYIPKHIAKVIDDLVNPPIGTFQSITRVPMQIFRTSLLFMAPQWYLQMPTDSILTFLQLDKPLTSWKYWGDALKMARNPEEFVQVNSLATPEKLSSARIVDNAHNALPPSVRGMQSGVEWLKGENVAAREQAISIAHQIKAGQAVARWGREAQAAMRKSALIDAPARGIAKISEKGMNLAETLEQMNINMGFLEGYDTALTKGLSRDEAIRMGVEKGRSIFETWDRATPIERSIIRSVFPFYGYTSNLFKYVLQYPVNHPTRLSILSNFGKAEMEDWGTGLPQKLHRLLWLGDVHGDGSAKAINIDFANPFRDVASYASMIGFITGQADGDLSALTKNLNPFLSTTLKELGVDTSKGAAGLYPDIYYNPTTGDLSARTGNPVLDLVNSLVPQSQLLTNSMGLNDQYNALLRTNPDAAAQMVTSNLRLPRIIPKEYGIPVERMKAEVLRFTQQQKDLSTALKTGDYSLADKWPGLKQTMDVIRSLTPEQRAAFTPEQEIPSTAEVYKSSLTQKPLDDRMHYSAAGR